MRLDPLLWVALIAGSAGAAAQAKPAPPRPDNVPLTTYTDPAHGVSFRYPAVWKQVPKLEGYSPPMAFGGKVKPTLMVQFTGAGNYYRKTTLDSLSFEYGSLGMASAADCSKLADDVAGGEEPKPLDVTINGVTFRHGSGQNSGLGHGLAAEVYTTYRGGVCYVFEEDFTTARGADDTRDLTEAEMKALQRHLDAIMFSVRLRR